VSLGTKGALQFKKLLAEALANLIGDLSILAGNPNSHCGTAGIVFYLSAKSLEKLLDSAGSHDQVRGKQFGRRCSSRHLIEASGR
jgi:hypothetical protein